MTANLYQPHHHSEVGPGIFATSLDGLWYVAPRTFPDHRGFYREISRVLEIDGLLKQPFVIKQINHAFSHQHVARGFHAESWHKMITVVSGVSWCVLADIRPSSPTFGQIERIQLGEGDESLAGSIFVSPGIANSYCVLQGPAHYLYFVDQLYAERDTSQDRAISLFDSDLAVEWPIPREKMIISDRDAAGIELRHVFPEKYDR